VPEDLRPRAGPAYRPGASLRVQQAAIAGADLVGRLEGLPGTPLDLRAGKALGDRERLLPGRVDGA
jgi:hypothetical protein